MGHDICGFASDDVEQATEIAYLRRSAFNPLARSIYSALDAQKYDCGCSGCGDVVHFTTDQLHTALTRLPDDEVYEQERKFLQDCIEKGGGSGAQIGFF